MEFDRVGTNVGRQMSEQRSSDPNSLDLPINETSKSACCCPRQVIASVAGATAIMIGAFGAHGLESYLPQTGIDVETIARRLQQFNTGARYHLAHAIVLLVLALSSI